MLEQGLERAGVTLGPQHLACHPGFPPAAGRPGELQEAGGFEEGSEQVEGHLGSSERMTYSWTGGRGSWASTGENSVQTSVYQRWGAGSVVGNPESPVDRPVIQGALRVGATL
jgi:hypothetical protein